MVLFCCWYFKSTVSERVLGSQECLQIYTFIAKDDTTIAGQSLCTGHRCFITFEIEGAVFIDIASDIIILFLFASVFEWHLYIQVMAIGPSLSSLGLNVSG